jgi:hypothetical protein
MIVILPFPRFSFAQNAISCASADQPVEALLHTPGQVFELDPHS